MPDTPILELLQQDILAALNGITPGNGYFTQIGTLSRGLLSPLETDQLPTASLLPVEDRPEYGAGVLRRTFTFTVRIWVDTPNVADAALVLGQFVSDVQRRLVVDPRRAGLAEDTRELGITFIYTVSTESLAGADVNFETEYYTQLTTPLAGV